MTVTLPPHRDVTLVLCLPDGSLLGALAPFRVDVPWWQEAGPVVAAARAAHGVEVTILRLLRAEAGRATRGGPVSYLAEIEQPPAAALVPWPGDPMADEPLRVHYARPGGPGNDLRWADSALAERGTPRTGPAEQVKTWNLSSLWRLPIGSSVAWLKAVPPFFAHESRILTLLDAAGVPVLVAADGPRMLLEDIPGVDQHRAVGAPTLVMVRLLVGLQVAWVARSDELLALGLPDWRAEPLAEAAADVVARTAPELEREVVQQLERLLDGFAQRSSEVESCGIPATLVHGDFHRGNVRGTPERLVLLDWGDCGVGHPLLDQVAFLEYLPQSEHEAVLREWSRLWRAAVPGCDPDRAALLLEPVAALRRAVVYRGFLDAIEPDERIYHASDPADWLTLTADLCRCASTD
jgi:phosphotransferase family enzyme